MSDPLTLYRDFRSLSVLATAMPSTTTFFLSVRSIACLRTTVSKRCGTGFPSRTRIRLVSWS